MHFVKALGIVPKKGTKYQILSVEGQGWDHLQQL